MIRAGVSESDIENKANILLFMRTQHPKDSQNKPLSDQCTFRSFPPHKQTLFLHWTLSPMCQVYRQLTRLLICCFLGVGAFSAHAEGIVQTKAPSACGDQAGAALTYSSDETDFDVNNYVFSWKKGGEEISTGVVADNLTEGTYTLSVTNNVTSTTTDYSYTIAAPIPLSVTASSTPIVDWRQTASSDKKGSITLQPKGGVAPYSYTLYDSTYHKTTSSFSSEYKDLMSGTYIVTVTDANGCTTQTRVVVENGNKGGSNNIEIGDTTIYACFDKMNIYAIQTSTSDKYEVGSIWDETTKRIAYYYVPTEATIASTSGYDKDTIFVPTDTIKSLVDGSDSIIHYQKYLKTVVRDNNGTDQIVVFQNESLISNNDDAPYIVTSSLSSKGMFDEVKDRNGITYTRLKKKPSTSLSSINLYPGRHTVAYWDYEGKGNRYSWELKTPSTPLTVNTTSTNNLCYNDKKAEIKVTAQGSWQGFTVPSATTGDSLFTIEISGGTLSSPHKVSNTMQTHVGKLGAGVYTVTVTDILGCMRQQSITITQPDYPIHIVFTKGTEVTCPLSMDGSATANVENAAYPIQSYQWSNGSTGESIVDVMAGSYTLNIVDANGCKASASTTLEASRRSCIYNLVTPNGDGYNDFFDLSDFCHNLKMDCNIFDANGRRVADLTEQNPKWDPREDNIKPVTGINSNYTAFIRLYTPDGKKIADEAETFSVIFEK